MKITLSKIRALARDNAVDLSPFAEHITRLEKSMAGGIEPSEINSLPLDGRYCLSLVLANLPSGIIQKEFGTDTLISTWAYYPPDNDPFEKREQLLQGLSRISGMDAVILEKARQTSWMIHSQRDPEIIFKNYELINELSGLINRAVDLPRLLTTCAKEGINLSKRRIPNYKLQVISTLETLPKGHAANWEITKTGGERKIFSFYIDSPVAVCLVYRDEPNAIAGISLKDEKTIFLSQIQGIEGSKVKGDEPLEKVHSRGLAVIDWEKLLILIVEEIGKAADCEMICIQSAKNNEWFKANTIVPLSRGLKRYDEKAQGLGYEQGKNGDWYKKLK